MFSRVCYNIQTALMCIPRFLDTSVSWLCLSQSRDIFSFSLLLCSWFLFLCLSFPSYINLRLHISSLVFSISTSASVRFLHFHDSSFTVSPKSSSFFMSFCSLEASKWLWEFQNLFRITVRHQGLTSSPRKGQEDTHKEEGSSLLLVSFADIILPVLSISYFRTNGAVKTCYTLQCIDIFLSKEKRNKNC